MPFNARSLRAPAVFAAVLVLCATAACNGHDDDRATLTDSAARELSGGKAHEAANTIAAFDDAPGAPATGKSAGQSMEANAGASDVALPALAVRTPAQAPADGSPGIDPLVTPVIHTAD
ncbi:hypothetical protein [Paraburkholderia sp. J12]|uniref:hypothetical protein n=1 Tax=Paraburkholderia sp. J12 TaxID=2805432 RepID=UPI002ABD924F|nr:hypothetical protein [Paraburkholderia sp. J12]